MLYFEDRRFSGGLTFACFQSKAENPDVYSWLDMTVLPLLSNL